MDELPAASVRLEWRDHQGREEASTSGAQQEAASPHVPEGFIAHRITKMDTLAGIALKYNVQVADIKRFNGLLSETAIYGLEMLLIPTQTFPVGEDVQQMFAQIANALGRDVLNAESASAVRARGVPLPIGELDPLAGVQGDLPWWCQCGACNDFGEDSNCRRMASVDRGGVELVERPQSGTMVPPSGFVAGPSRMHEQVRRRRQGDYCGLHGDDDLVSGGSFLDGPGSRSEGRPVRERSSNGAPETDAAAAFFASLGRAIGETSSALVQKIKKVASQPALAGPSSPSLADAADGVMSSLRQGLLPKGNLSTGRQDWHSSRPAAPSPLSSVPPSVVRRKGGKCD